MNNEKLIRDAVQLQLDLHRSDHGFIDLRDALQLILLKEIVAALRSIESAIEGE